MNTSPTSRRALFRNGHASTTLARRLGLSSSLLLALAASACATSTDAPANAEHARSSEFALVADGHTNIASHLDLTIDAMDPAQPVEGRPVFVSFTLTNNSHDVQHGYVEPMIETTDGPPQVFWQNAWTVTNLQPGATLRGVTTFTLPHAGIGSNLNLYFYQSVTIVDEFNRSESDHLADDFRTFNTAARYQIGLDKIHVTTTRAHQTDKDKIAFSADFDGQSLEYEGYQIDNAGEGDHPVGLKTQKFDSVPGLSPLVHFDWVIINAGSVLESIVEHVLDAASSASAGIVTAELGGGSSWQSVDQQVQWLNKQQFEGCDGPVSLDDLTIASNVLDDMTHVLDRVQREGRYGGAEYESQLGCGRTSDYTVTWSLARFRTPDDVILIAPPVAQVREGQTVRFQATNAPRDRITEAPVPLRWRVPAGASEGWIDPDSGVFTPPSTLPLYHVSRVTAETYDGLIVGEAFVGLDAGPQITEVAAPPPPPPISSACQKASNMYAIDAGVTWGFAPPDVQDWWKANNCNTRPAMSNACQLVSDTYGTNAGVTWGFAPQNVQSFWGANNCNTRPTSDACQIVSDRYATDAGVTWGFAPLDVQNFWRANNCNTRPASSNGCQLVSDLYGTDAGITWGFAPKNVQDYWGANSCNTRPQR